mmetsp:Transcript_9843/g.1453  ORF Transcript_9843/g.1453 Transcript_9843/m.1453 type:complete len:87 (+) Transcript_9843:93-353(+)
MSVSNYAYRFDPNFRFRPNMEDASRIVDSFMGDPNQGYFAIFDGHGGSEAVDYCKNRFHSEFQRSIQSNRQNITNAINTCFLRIDD